jgi:hypothetical protein
MRTKSRRRGRGLALAVVAVLAFLPQMARAQQGGLFPLHPIKRHRVPCDQEDPIYKINKYQYFGYHPTCWHTFPGGWGCPSDQAPNREKSLQELPLGSGGGPATEGELGPETGERREMENPPARPRSPLPAVPRGDVFETPPAAPGAAPGGTPRDLRESPFDQPDTRGNLPPRDNAPGQPAPANPPRGNAAERPSPFDEPAPSPSPRSSRDVDSDDLVAGGSDGPTLAVPAINVPALTDAGSVYEPPPTQTASAGSASPATNSSVPPRRSLISGFLSNMGINWIRR